MREIIDAHHHLTDLTRSYPWLEGAAEPVRYHGDDRPLRRSYLLDDYLRDCRDYRLVASVHVENGAADSLAESRWIADVHADRRLPSVHVARVSLLDPDAAHQLDRHAAIPLVRGIRHILNWHEDPTFSHTDRGDIMRDPLWRDNFGLLHTHGLSFDLQVFPSQLREAAELAGAFPETTIILDHAGMPIGRDADSWHQWERGMRAMAARPNVVVKISALGTNDHSWTRESIAPFVRETIDIFGPSRAMLGSNFPVDSLYSSFTTLYEAFEELTADLSGTEQSDLFAETAARAYRIEREAPEVVPRTTPR
jgi:predicted TIM-barrel fold metal-dependent hydrolase